MANAQRYLIVFFAVLGLATLGLWQFAGAQGQKKPEYPKFEYKILTSANGNELNAYGNEGWELVAVEPASNASIYFFKRPK